MRFYVFQSYLYVAFKKQGNSSPQLLLICKSTILKFYELDSAEMNWKYKNYVYFVFPPNE